MLLKLDRFDENFVAYINIFVGNTRLMYFRCLCDPIGKLIPQRATAPILLNYRHQWVEFNWKAPWLDTSLFIFDDFDTDRSGSEINFVLCVSLHIFFILFWYYFNNVDVIVFIYFSFNCVSSRFVQVKEVQFVVKSGGDRCQKVSVGLDNLR